MQEINTNKDSNLLVRRYIRDEKFTPEIRKKYEKKYGEITSISPDLFCGFYICHEIDLNSPFAVI